MKQLGKFILGALAGALFAAAIVILLTPTSGNDLKKRIKDRIAAIRSEMTQAAEERRNQMELELEALRQPKKETGA
jgi:gas vesicle protein